MDFPVKIDMYEVCNLVKDFLSTKISYEISYTNENTLCVQTKLYNRLWFKFVENGNEVKLFYQHYNDYRNEIKSSLSGVSGFIYYDHINKMEDLYEYCYMLVKDFLGE